MTISTETIRSCVIWALLTLVAPAIARAASVTIEAGAVEAARGAEVVVPIVAVGAQGMGPLQFDLLYDPAVLVPAAEAVTPSADLAGAMVECNPNEPGRLRIAMISGEPIDGNMSLLDVHFTGTGNGEAGSRLELVDIRAWSHQDILEMRVATRDGNVRFVAASASRRPPLLIGAGVVALLLAIAGILITRVHRGGRHRPPKAGIDRHHGAGHLGA